MTLGGTHIQVPIGESYILVNGVRVNNDTAASLKDGRTYLPIRVVLEALGYQVGWDAATRTVLVQGQ